MNTTVTSFSETSDSLKEIKDDITELLRNTKWLYKYGGSGSGSGSGTSSNTTKTPQIHVQVDTISLWSDGSTVKTLNWTPTKNKSYAVTLSTRYLDSSVTYKLLYKYSGDANYTSVSTNSDGEGVFLLVPSKNDTIIFRLWNDYEHSAVEGTIAIQYIVDYIKIDEISLVDLDKNPLIVSDNEILLGSVDLAQLKISDTITEPGTLTIKYTDLEGISGTITTKSSSADSFISICSSEFIRDLSKLGFYTFKLSGSYAPDSDPEQVTVLEDLKDISYSLIPNDLYVLIIPSLGTIYNEVLEKPDYIYTSGYRNFSIKIYSGLNNRESFTRVTCSIILNGEELQSTIISDLCYERDSLTYSPYFKSSSDTAEEGILKVTLNKLDGTLVTVKKYFYLKKSETAFDWFRSKSNSNRLELYFNKEGETSEGLKESLSNYISTNKIELTQSSNSITIPLDTLIGNSTKEFMFSIGLLYSEINESDVDIVKLSSDGGSLDITISLNSSNLGQVSIGNDAMDCYIPRESYSTYNTPSGVYHLITLYRRYLYPGTQTGSNFFEWDIYIDGILEHTVQSFTEYADLYNTLILNPTEDKKVNVLINHLGIYEFNVNSTTSESSYIYDSTGLQSRSTKYNGMSDLDVVQYYYSYSLTTREDLTDYNTILNSYKGFNYTFTDGKRDDYIKLDESLVKSIASTAGIPSIIINIPDENALSYISNTGYGEEDSFSFTGCSVKYKEKNAADFVEATSSVGNEYSFTLSLQGSSTKSYRVKNFELSIDNDSDTALNLVYSLNYDPDDDTSFYPENSFTFKADLVDSSHSNNTTCGNFINKVMTPYSEVSDKKVCLIGYPVLFFIEIDGNYYDLGIYNYNLGRESKYNLGHSDPKTESFNNKGFIVSAINNTAYKSDFIVAEIQNNSPYWDYSQYDPSILFKGKAYKTSDLKETMDVPVELPDGSTKSEINDDVLYMWGDIKWEYSTEHNDTFVQDKILSFTECIAKTGGQVFNSIGKEFNTTRCYPANSKLSDECYKIINTVPDYKTQYKRYIIRGDSTYFGYTGETVEADSLSLEDRLKSCIETVKDGDTTVLPRLDYTSAMEYYTICMGLGLVDSVEKNQNIKSWNSGDTFHLAFYDMDTSFGIDNAGSYVSPFAFSDYWKRNEDGSMDVYRDYWDPTDNVNTGYDIPSSYLFAIVKYAQFVNANTNILSSTLKTPTEYWSELRSTTGELLNASYFMKNYFNKNTEDINPIVWNLNYRYKYLQRQEVTEEISNVNQFRAKDFAFFHGRRQYYTEDWLNKRLHMLDAYFNLNGIPYNVGGSITEKFNSINSSTKNNDDVLILHLIFNGGSSDSFKSNTNLSLTLRVNLFSPSVIDCTNVKYRLLFEKPNTDYTLALATSGNQNWAIWGSGSWTYMNNIDSFITPGNTINIKSSLLKNIVATSATGTVTPSSWIFTIPSLVSLELSNPNFKNDLYIYNSENLLTLNISGTSVHLVDSNPSSLLNNFSALKTLNLSNLKNSGKIVVISGTNNVNSLNLNGATIESLKITPINCNVSISNSNIGNINLTSYTLDNSFTLSNDLSVTSISLDGFKSINISKCTSFNKLILTNPDKLETLSITSCTNTITCGSTTGVLDLSACTNLKTLYLNGCSKITKVILPSNKIIEVGNYAFLNCYALTQISGKIKVTGATLTFKNCTNLHINSGLTLSFDSSITSLDNTFSGYKDTPNVFNDADLTTLNNSLTSSEIKDKITSLKETFMWTKIASVSKLFTGTDSTKVLKALTSADNTFKWCPITETLTSDILNYGNNITTFNMFNLCNNYSETWSWAGFSTGTLKFTIYAFKNIGSNLTSITCQCSSVSVVDYGDNTNPLPLRDFITQYCPKLKTFAMDFAYNKGTNSSESDVYVDFSDKDGVYALPNTLTSLSLSSYGSRLFACNFDSAFLNLINLSNITCFYNVQICGEGQKYDDEGNIIIYYSSAPTDISASALPTPRVNIYTLFDWNSLVKNCTSIFVDDTYDSGFDFIKQITYSDFKSLLNILFSTTKTTSLGRIFCNCFITNYSSDTNYSSSEGVLKVKLSDISSISTKYNTTIKALKRTFNNLRCKNSLSDTTSTDYLDFLGDDTFLFFQKLSTCTTYYATWSSCRLYTLYDKWFLTSNKITNCYYTFSGCVFKVPYCIGDGKISDFYYNSTPLIWALTSSGNEERWSYNLTILPDDYEGLYIVYPTIFNNMSNCTVEGMFANSNLFGTIPSNLFRENGNYTSLSNVRNLFLGTIIVPQLIKSIYFLKDEQAYKINKYCYIPNSPDSKPYFLNYISISDKDRETGGYDGTFASAVISGGCEDDNYISSDDYNKFEEGLNEDLDISIHTSDENQETDKEIYVINSIYVFNNNSLDWSCGNYINLLPKYIVQYTNDNTSCVRTGTSRNIVYTNTGNNDIVAFSTNNISNYKFNYGSEFKSINKRTHFNARYGGDDSIIDIRDSKDGLPLKLSTSSLKAYGLISNFLSSIYCGYIFANYTLSDNKSFKIPTNMTLSVPVIDSYRRSSSSLNNGNNEFYSLCREMLFPYAANKNISNFIRVITTNDSLTRYCLHAYSNLIVGNPNFYKNSNVSTTTSTSSQQLNLD